jgi:hypothetical protein
MGAVLAACGSQPTAPAPVPATSPAPPVTPPPTIPQTGSTLSGVVFENTADGRRAVAGGGVNYYVNTGIGFPRVPMDANGRYTIPNLPDGSRIRLVAFAAFGNGQLEQPCGAYASVNGDTVRDIELTRPGAHGLSPAPRLFGVVYYTIGEERRPLAHTRVLYFSDPHSYFEAYTTTDSDGRYEVCGFPLGPGAIGAGDCNDSLLQVPVQLRGDTNVFDVNLTPLVTGCPGELIPRPS